MEDEKKAPAESRSPADSPPRVLERTPGEESLVGLVPSPSAELEQKDEAGKVSPPHAIMAETGESFVGAKGQSAVFPRPGESGVLRKRQVQSQVCTKWKSEMRLKKKEEPAKPGEADVKAPKELLGIFAPNHLGGIEVRPPVPNIGKMEQSFEEGIRQIMSEKAAHQLENAWEDELPAGCRVVRSDSHGFYRAVIYAHLERVILAGDEALKAFLNQYARLPKTKMIGRRRS